MSVLKLNTVFTTPKKLFLSEVKEFLYLSVNDQKFIQKSDVSYLPDPVQRYLKFSGFAGNPQSDVTEVLWADSKIRFSLDKKWISLSTQQYIFASSSTRLAYMHTQMAGFLPFDGRDRYDNGSGHMYGKLAKMITVFNNRSQEVALGGAVVLLAESLLEPTIAIQNYITWEPVNANTARATLRNGNLEVRGRFFFNEKGEYIRFESDDRPFDLGKGVYKIRPFSITLGEYHEVDGFKMPNRVSATWHLEDGDFTYWDGQISGLRRNVVSINAMNI